MSEKEVGLPQAAQRLGVTYYKAWNLVLGRKLEGRQDGSRWVVTEKSINAVLRRGVKAVLAELRDENRRVAGI